MEEPTIIPERDKGKVRSRAAFIQGLIFAKIEILIVKD